MNWSEGDSYSNDKFLAVISCFPRLKQVGFFFSFPWFCVPVKSQDELAGDSTKIADLIFFFRDSALVLCFFFFLEYRPCTSWPRRLALRKVKKQSKKKNAAHSPAAGSVEKLAHAVHADKWTRLLSRRWHAPSSFFVLVIPVPHARVNFI